MKTHFKALVRRLASARTIWTRQARANTTRVFLGFVTAWALSSDNVPGAVRESNPPIPSPLGAFNTLKRNGEPLGFHLNGAPSAPGDPLRTVMHFQGIQRSLTPGPPHVFVTRSGSAAIAEANEPGNLMVVRLDSRDPYGERLRSNRLREGIDVNSTPPPPEDRVVTNLTFRYSHPGGIQLCGDILAVPLESALDDGLPDSRIDFFNVANPVHPVHLSSFEINGHNAGVVGLTKLPDGHFLMVVTWGDNAEVEFFRSTGTSFFDTGFTFQLHDRWSSTDPTDAGPAQNWPTGPAHQSLSLFNGTDGQVYMIGALNTQILQPYGFGDDLLFIYRIDGWQSGASRVAMVRLAPPKHLDCSTDDRLPIAPHPTYRKNADFLAGTGIYISPTGELLFYATEHYSHGPASSVRLVEFHHQDMARPDSPLHSKQAIILAPPTIPEGNMALLDGRRSVPQLIRPWIELFKDAGFNGSSVVMDWPDHGRDDYDDFSTLDSFNDAVSSFRWWGPAGWKLELFEHDHFSGGVLSRTSDGSVQELQSLSGHPLNDQISSVRFLPPPNDTLDAPLTFAWKLSVSPQVAALEAPDSPLPRLKAVNGPNHAIVELQVGPAPTDAATAGVQILNVAPKFEDVRFMPLSPAGKVRLRVDAADPGTLDVLDLEIDWGDGSGTQTLRGGNAAQRRFEAEHQYLRLPAHSGLQSSYVVQMRLGDGDDRTEALENYTVIWDNSPPIAAVNQIHAIKGRPLKFKKALLVADDTDPEGVAVTLVGVASVSANGVPINILGDWLLYDA
ncbi:MAG: hypothetical protein L0Z50_28830, partial [Verrucomicrobiales bacterium]|nr:hypothetical protein [Verrucomicrobiales bacterium]